MKKLPITVILLTLNEGHHLDACLSSIKTWAEDIFIVDSLSSDKTIDVAIQHNVKVVQRPFKNFGDQWNWALENLPIKSPWTMKLDPDERMTDELRNEIATVISSPDAKDAYTFRRQLWFMGHKLRLKSWVLRLWKTNHCRFTNALVNEHPEINGQIGKLKHYLLHYDSPTLYSWFIKQNFYTELSAIEIMRGNNILQSAKIRGNATERHLWRKAMFMKMPCRHFIRRMYTFFIAGAILDGRIGWYYAQMRANVGKWADYKYYEMKYAGKAREVPRLPHGEYDERVVNSEIHQSVHAVAKAKEEKVKETTSTVADRISIIAHNCRVAGGLSVGKNLIRAMLQQNPDKQFQITLPPGVGYEEVVKGFSNVEAYYYDAPKYLFKRFLFDTFELPKVIKKFNPDVVFGLGNFGLFKPPCPQAILYHNPNNCYPKQMLPKMDLRTKLIRFVQNSTIQKQLNRSDLMICQTKSMEGRLRAKYTYGGRSTLCPNIVSEYLMNAPVASSVPEKLKEFDGKFKFIFVTRYYSHKNLEILVDVFDKYRDELKDAVFITTIDWEQSVETVALKKRIDELGLDKQFVSLGLIKQEELAGYYQNCDALLMPTILESFSITYMEAMYYGIPILTSNLDFAKEICGEAALFFDPHNPDSIYLKMKKIMNEDESRQELTDIGRKRLSEFGTKWDQNAENLISCFDEISTKSKQKTSA